MAGPGRPCARGPRACGRCGGKRWLLLVDLDGTIWDTLNISGMEPPFRRISEGSIEDSRGRVVRVYEEALKIVRWASSECALVSTLSWNVAWIAMEALKELGLAEEFDYHAIEPHPRKGEMIGKLLDRIREERSLEIPVECIVYIDDRRIHLPEIYESLGKVNFLQAWRDFQESGQAIGMIRSALKRCRMLEG